MAFALVASTSASTAVGDAVTTSPIDTTGANLIVVAVCGYTGIGAITDSEGNTDWTGLTAEANISTMIRIFYKVAPATDAAHTFTVTGIGIYTAFAVLAVSGAHATPFYAESAGAIGTGVATIQPGSLTPPVPGCLLVTGIVHGVDGSISIDLGYSQDTETNSSGVHVGGGIGWLIQGAAAAANPTWTLAGPGSPAAVHAVFVPTYGGGGGGVFSVFGPSIIRGES